MNSAHGTSLPDGAEPDWDVCSSYELCAESPFPMRLMAWIWCLNGYNSALNHCSSCGRDPIPEWPQPGYALFEKIGAIRARGQLRPLSLAVRWSGKLPLSSAVPTHSRWIIGADRHVRLKRRGDPGDEGLHVRWGLQSRHAGALGRSQ